MVFPKFSLYVPNIEAWKKFYENQPQEYKSFYTIGHHQHPGEKMEAVKLVTPTESVIEQAKSDLKRQRRLDDALNESPPKKCKKNKNKPKRKKVVKKSTWKK